MNFEQAYIRLKEITETLKSKDIIWVDEIIALQKEANQLYEFCDNQLKKVETEIV